MTKRNVDQILLEALAGGCTQREAAKRAGVTERTVYNRLQVPEFQAALAQLEAERDEASRARLVRGAGQAADNLIEGLKNATRPGPKFRYSAAILQLVFPKGEPPAPSPQSTDGGATMAKIRRWLDEHAAEPGTDSPAESATKPEKTGKNRGRVDWSSAGAAFPNRTNPFPASRSAAAQ